MRCAGGVLELPPPSGAVAARPVRPDPSVAEPEPFTVRVTLADGNAIELSRLGRMRTQLLAELRDGRSDAAASAVAAVGDAAVFSARSGGDPAEVRVYDDALLVIGAAGSDDIRGVARARPHPCQEANTRHVSCAEVHDFRESPPWRSNTPPEQGNNKPCRPPGSRKRAWRAQHPDPESATRRRPPSLAFRFAAATMHLLHLGAASTGLPWIAMSPKFCNKSL